MFNSKLLWRMAVIILIVAFSAATIVSCGNKTPTQSTSLSTSSGGGTTGGGGTTDSGSITLPEEVGSLYTVDVPFASSKQVVVDYRDTAKLNQLWLDQINRKAANDGKVFAIRNGRNPYGPNDFQKKDYQQKTKMDIYKITTILLLTAIFTTNQITD